MKKGHFNDLKFKCLILKNQKIKRFFLYSSTVASLVLLVLNHIPRISTSDSAAQCTISKLSTYSFGQIIHSKECYRHRISSGYIQGPIFLNSCTYLEFLNIHLIIKYAIAIALQACMNTIRVYLCTVYLWKGSRKSIIDWTKNFKIS